jgi:hypothetical protein
VLQGSGAPAIADYGAITLGTLTNYATGQMAISTNGTYYMIAPGPEWLVSFPACNLYCRPNTSTLTPTYEFASLIVEFP